MRVSDFTTTQFVELSPKSTIRETLAAFLKYKLDIGCVTIERKLAGIVTKYSIYRLLLQDAPLDSQIQPVIKTNVVTLNKNESLYVAKNILQQNNVGHAVVMNEDRTVYGVMAKADLIKGLIADIENKAGRMKALVHHLQDAVISVDHQLHIMAYNHTACELFHLDQQNLSGLHISHILPDLSDRLEHTIASGSIMEGQRIHLHSSTVIASFIPIREFKRITGAMVVLRDVTSFEKIAQELESTKRLEKILDSAMELAYDGVVITDKKGRITKANPGFVQLYGYATVEEVIGKPIAQIAPEIPADKSLITNLEIDGELVQIKDKKCILAQRPIYRDEEKLGAIFKIIFRQIHLWKDLFQHMEQLEHEITYYRGELLRITHRNDPFAHLISRSQLMEKMKKEAYIAAQSFSTILITGESGTGKGLLAEGIHNLSGRPGAFIKVNCAAIPEELLESEFFGYADGAFTGARKGGKPGKFELAHQGTLFLDEIGDMPLSLQAKLLRVLQEREFERIGDTKTTHVDVRIIAATNKDLQQLVQEKRFREDLYYRIHVIHIHIPSLRDRLEDIPLLCDHFVRKNNAQTNKSIIGITPEVLNVLKCHNWPGNVRELENVMERAFHFSQSNWIEAHHLPSHIRKIASHPAQIHDPSLHCQERKTDEYVDRQELIDKTEKAAILKALSMVNGNRTKAAELLGLSRSSLYQKLKKYNIKEVSKFQIS